MHALLSRFAADSACTNDGFCTNLPKATADSANVQHLLQIVFAIFAVVAVLVIVIAAFNIVIAQGDSSKVAKQRGNIIYALVGLAIAISAEAVVSFVLGRF